MSAPREPTPIIGTERIRFPNRPRHCWEEGEVCYERVGDLPGTVSLSHTPPGPEETRRLQRQALPWWRRWLP